MSEISLEWFFQIPGLFITIGVLLILIALLVLIIGSSKARNKKTEDLALVDDVEQEESVNEAEPVNILNPNVAVNHLNGATTINNVSDSINNLQNNEANKVESTLPVTNEVTPLSINNENTTLEENSLSTVTPVNLNESVVTPIVENSIGNDTITNQNEPVAIGEFPSVVPPIVDPISFENSVLPVTEEVTLESIPTVDEVTREVVTPIITEEKNVDNGEFDNIMKEEATVAPIFGEPVVNNVVTEPSPIESQLVEPVTKTIGDLEMVNPNNNFMENASVSKTIEPVSEVTPISLTEVVEPMQKKAEDLLYNNETLVSPTIASVNDGLNNPLPVENTEIEEIL